MKIKSLQKHSIDSLITKSIGRSVRIKAIDHVSKIARGKPELRGYSEDAAMSIAIRLHAFEDIQRILARADSFDEAKSNIEDEIQSMRDLLT